MDPTPLVVVGHGTVDETGSNPQRDSNAFGRWIFGGFCRDQIGAPRSYSRHWTPDKRPVPAARIAPGLRVNGNVAKRLADEMQATEVASCPSRSVGFGAAGRADA